MYGDRAIPSPFYCPEANKEVNDALAVGYGAAKRFWFFYSGQKCSPHFPFPARSQKEQQGEVA